jgi:predicted transcriptional regulator
VTRQRKLREVLNLRLDEPLAREIERIAQAEDRSESEVARTLLSYGVEVVRRLEADAFAQPFAWTERPDHEPHPEIVEIRARKRPMTDEEIDRRGLRPYVGDTVEAEDDE